MTTLDRHECVASLMAEWEQMPEGDPARRERWFCEVGSLIASIEDLMAQQRWIKAFGRAIHEKHSGLPESICTYIVQQRVDAAQKGGVMYRQNVRRPVAASGTAEEFLGKQPEFISAEDAAHDRRVLMMAIILGAVLLGMAFWPAILGWMTPFKYGVLAGALGMAALLIGLVAVGVCLGASNLEKRP